MILEGIILFYWPDINDQQLDMVISGTSEARASNVHGGITKNNARENHVITIIIIKIT